MKERREIRGSVEHTSGSRKRPRALSVNERNSLLHRAWELTRDRDYPGVRTLLSPISRSHLLDNPELGYLLANAGFSTGEWEHSLDLVLDLTEPIDRLGHPWLSRHRLHLEGIIRMNRGEIAEARAIFLEVLEMASGAGDDGLAGATSTDLGITADIQCRWEEALSNYQRASAMYQRVGSQRGVGSVHHNLAMTYRQMGFYAEADTHFEHAMLYFRQSGSDAEIAGCDMERALLLSTMGDSDRAGVIARRARDCFVEIGHIAGDADSLRVLGIIAARQGKRSEARGLLEDALTRIRTVTDRLTEAEILEELAVLEHLEGNATASADRAGEARRLYLQLGATPRAERLGGRLVRQEHVEGEVEGSR
ncbi:MAG TPA: tetratricopeptide repeat protein [Longimicrobiaceae bacterium]|nr:tetratricopeptide repeat protein [Longimicrobiaceae bacterium]